MQHKLDENMEGSFRQSISINLIENKFERLLCERRQWLKGFRQDMTVAELIEALNINLRETK